MPPRPTSHLPRDRSWCTELRPTGPYHRDLTLRRDGAWVVLTDALTGRVLGSHRLAALRGIAIEGAYGAVDNTLTVDLSGGPIDVTRGISWDGGVGGYNTLDVRGGGVTRASDLALGQHSGVYTLGSTRITYSHIAPITDNTPATVYTFIMPSATTSVIVSTGALPGTLTINCLEGSSPSAEQAAISNKAQVTIQASPGDATDEAWTLDAATASTGLTSIAFPDLERDGRDVHRCQPDRRPVRLHGHRRLGRRLRVDIGHRHIRGDQRTGRFGNSLRRLTPRDRVAHLRRGGRLHRQH